MYLAMNRFQINEGREQDFIDIWKNRDSHLKDVPGFQAFNLLQGNTENGITLFSSHASWENREAFEAWTKSEAFRKAHANAGKQSEGIYAGPPKLELFDSVL